MKINNDPCTVRLPYALIGLLIVLLITGCQEVTAQPSVSVTQFGAVGNGKTNATSAFAKAFASGAKSIEIPSGTYLIGPTTLQVPPDVTLHGAGSSSVLKLAPSTAILFTPSANDCFDNFAFDGLSCKSGDEHAGGLINAFGAASGSSFRQLQFDHCDRLCINLDHANNTVVEDCTFTTIGMPVQVVFAHRVRIVNNSATDARLSGIEFWGNSNYQIQDASDIQIIGNYFKNAGEGVWGAGATRVIMANNIVDGSTDVGLDLEWCDDSVISGNTVRNCRNAEISLFFACKHISITGNTCINDGPIGDPKAGWYVRSGIWLVYPNTDQFKQDTGHQDVSIVGNTIWCADDAPRRAIWIGSESNNITLASNTIDGGAIWKGGHDKVHPMVLEQIDDNTVVHSTKQIEAVSSAK